METTNTRAAGFVLTLLHQVDLSPLGPLARNRGERAEWATYFVA